MLRVHTSPSLGLAILRIMLGTIFFIHGSQKILGLFGGTGLAGFAVWLGKYGFSATSAYVIAFAQFISSILMITGWYARLGAFINGLIMVGAMIYLTWPHGFFWHTNGYEFALTLAISCLAIIVGGPGKMTFK